MPHVEGVAHRLLHVNDVDIHVAEAGEGAPLLLIHGYPQHWYVWRKLIPELAQEHRVICTDLRGFGWSEAPREGYDKETLMWDVLAVLDELDIETVPVAGHDWGGWIGMLMGMLAPERLQRVLVMSVSHPFFQAKLATFLMSWRIWHGMTLGTPGLRLRATRSRFALGRQVARWLGGGAWSEQQWHIFLDQFEEPQRAWAAHQLYYINGTTDFPKVVRGRYRRIGMKAPGLVLHGERDRAYLPWRPAEYQPYAPNLTHEIVAGAGHALIEDRPDLVLEKIRSFLVPAHRPRPAA
jgi:pimeloyl-ACP methyl ester carboxylesterase